MAEPNATGEQERPTTVIAAMLANGAIMVAKLGAAMVTGSAGLFAEAIHSAVDAANQGLVLIGVHRSRRPADAKHPFGYGKEVYFWALIYAVLLFGIGGGVSVYQGVSRLLDPAPPGSFVVGYAVLGVAFVAESISFTIAVRAIQKRDRGRGFFDKLFHSKSPSRFVVVGEDGAALVGLTVAFAGLAATHVTGSPAYDAAASIAVGVVLGAAATYLAVQTHRLLIGEATDEEMVEALRRITDRRREVVSTGTPFTMHLGPDSILVALDIHFRSDLSADQLARAVDAIEDAIREEDPRVARIFIEARLRDGDIEQPDGSRAS